MVGNVIPAWCAPPTRPGSRCSQAPTSPRGISTRKSVGLPRPDSLLRSHLAPQRGAHASFLACLISKKVRLAISSLSIPIRVTTLLSSINRHVYWYVDVLSGSGYLLSPRRISGVHRCRHRKRMRTPARVTPDRARVSSSTTTPYPLPGITSSWALWLLDVPECPTLAGFTSGPLMLHPSP